MANEATFVKINSDKGLHQVTVADGAGIEKGTVLKWSADPNTAAASSADGDYVAGILAEEKVASDGQTEVSVYTEDCVVALTTVASPAAIAIGKPVKIAGANLIDLADDDTVEGSAEIVGYAMETVAATVQETIQVRLKVGG